MSEDGIRESLHAGLENGINNCRTPVKAIKAYEEEHQTEDSLKEAVDPSNEALESSVEYSKTSLDITVHKATGNVVLKVVSDEDGKVIREIPFEKLFFQESKHEEIEGLLAYKSF